MGRRTEVVAPCSCSTWTLSAQQWGCEPDTSVKTIMLVLLGTGRCVVLFGW